MIKESGNRIILHSGVVGILSALGLLIGAAKVQAAQTQVDALEPLDNDESDGQSVRAIAERQKVQETAAALAREKQAVLSPYLASNLPEPISTPAPDAVAVITTDLGTTDVGATDVDATDIYTTAPNQSNAEQPVTEPAAASSLITLEIEEPVSAPLPAVDLSPNTATQPAFDVSSALTLEMAQLVEAEQTATADESAEVSVENTEEILTDEESDRREDDIEEDEEDEEDKGQDEITTTDAPLITLVDPELETEIVTERDAVLLAIASSDPDYLAERKKAPWLGNSQLFFEPEEPAIPQIALRSANEEEDEEEQNRSLIARLSGNAEADDDTVKPDWLALSGPDAEADPRADIFRRPGTQLSIDLSDHIPDKRSADWVTLTPYELMAPGSALNRSDEEGVEVAVRTPASSSSSRIYDVGDLSLVAITPTYLADAEENQVSVGASEVEFLSPESGAFLDIPSTPVVLRFPTGAKIALLANGREVDVNLVGRTETDSQTGLRTQTWYGVTLQPGENLLEIVSTDTGEVLQGLPLFVRGGPSELVLLTPRAIPSDGRSTSPIRGQLLDEEGNISLWGTVATLRASDGEFIGADQDPDAPGFQVLVNDGEFVAELQSSLESHLVQLQASVGGYQAFGQIQFVTPQRPSLLSGVVDLRVGARGTDYYDSFREFLPIDDDNSYEVDIDAAVFATGNLGEWLYTGAYNSDRSLNENCRGETALFSTSAGSCDNAYATYGDDSHTDAVAPSLDSLYLRFERNSPSNPAGIDYAMWGDFDTEEFATPAQVFTSTTRQLHGFKASYNFGNLAATGFYANNVEGFQRDVIPPDGTSGFYFTSQRDIVSGSETVYLETEELERPGTVLDRQQLSRGLDYDIDYDRGTLLFSDPIMQTTVDEFGQLLVRRIVATYQYENGSDTNVLAGRLQYTLNRKQGRESWLGTSYLTENQGNRDFTLFGADTRISLGENAHLTAEIARSSHNFDSSDTVSGNAYRVEFDGSLGGLNSRAYYRSTDTGFSNLATTSFVPGQTRYGAQLSGQLGSTTTLRAQFDHEDNFGTTPRIDPFISPLLSGLEETTSQPVDNSLTTYSLGLTQKIGRSTAEVDWIHRDRTDRINSDSNVSSDQLRSRFTTPITRKLSFVAQNELNLSSNVDPIYPSRTLLGLNWEVMRGVNVGLNQIFYGGGGNSRGSSTSLDVTGEHTFSTDTTVRGRFSTVDGRQIGGSIGLEQGIVLAPGLNLDLGYERTFSTLGNETAVSTQVSQPFASGNNASALRLSGGESYHVGLSYTDSADFQASTRFEHRRSSQGTNTVLTASALGRLSPALTVLGDYRLAHTANQSLRGAGTTSLLKLGLAYRDPNDDRFNALLRYEYRQNPNTLPVTASTGTSTTTQEHLFSAEAIYAPDWRWELYGKYAIRNSSTDIGTAGNNFSSNSTVQLAQARATYRLGYRWDMVGEARWLGGSGYNETGFSVEAGYYPLPDLRISAGYSGGATDYDFGENRSAGGFYIGATAKLSGLLNGFGTQPAAPIQQRESIVEVSHDSSQEQPTAASLENATENEPTTENATENTAETAVERTVDRAVENAVERRMLNEIESEADSGKHTETTSAENLLDALLSESSDSEENYPDAVEY
ncbi:MAG: TonB-dependent receptor [Cyanobacteria bacterium J06607_13]